MVPSKLIIRLKLRNSARYELPERLSLLARLGQVGA